MSVCEYPGALGGNVEDSGRGIYTIHQFFTHVPKSATEHVKRPHTCILQIIQGFLELLCADRDIALSVG